MTSLPNQRYTKLTFIVKIFLTWIL